MRKFQTWVVISDTHVPFHNARLLAKIGKVIRDIRATGLVIAGDFMDLFSLSKYAADSLYQLKDITLSGEYAAGNKLLDQLDDALPRGAKKHYLFGNHEDRYFREIKKGETPSTAMPCSPPPRPCACARGATRSMRTGRTMR